MHKNHTNNTNGIIPPILTHNTIVSTNYHWDKAYNSPSRFVEGMARKRSDWRRNYDNQILILLICKNHRACSEVHTFTRTDSQNDDRCIMLCRYCLMMLIVRYRSSNQPLARTHASRVEIKAILERDDLNMTADTVTPGPREKCDTRDKTGNACQTVPHFFTQGSRLVLPINRSFFHLIIYSLFQLWIIAKSLNLNISSIISYLRHCLSCYFFYTNSFFVLPIINSGWLRLQLTLMSFLVVCFVFRRNECGLWSYS